MSKIYKRFTIFPVQKFQSTQSLTQEALNHISIFFHKLFKKTVHNSNKDIHSSDHIQIQFFFSVQVKFFFFQVQVKVVGFFQVQVKVFFFFQVQVPVRVPLL